MITGKTPSQLAIRRYLMAGVAAIALFAGGIGGWATTTDIAGAVIAQGQIVVDTNVKKVQHQNGGIVGEILAHLPRRADGRGANSDGGA